MALAKVANAFSGLEIKQHRDTIQAGNTGGDCQPFGIRQNSNGVYFAGDSIECRVAELNFAITSNRKLPVWGEGHGSNWAGGIFVRYRFWDVERGDY